MKKELWLAAAHVVGVILWVGGLTAVLSLLHVHPRVEEAGRKLLTQLERRLALVMDLGATIAIATGLYRALSRTPNEFGNGGWLHIKLTAVAICILSVHGIARVKIKKYREGDARPLPPVVWILLAAGVLAATILGANKLLMRG
jgi:putative membrane protein